MKKDKQFRMSINPKSENKNNLLNLTELELITFNPEARIIFDKLNNDRNFDDDIEYLYDLIKHKKDHHKFSNAFLDIIKRKFSKLNEGKNNSILKRLEERESIIIDNIKVLIMYLEFYINNKPLDHDVIGYDNIKDYKYLHHNSTVNIRRIIIKFLLYQLYKVLNDNILEKEKNKELDFIFNNIVKGMKYSYDLSADADVLAVGQSKSVKKEKSKGASLG